MSGSLVTLSALVGSALVHTWARTVPAEEAGDEVTCTNTLLCDGARLSISYSHWPCCSREERDVASDGYRTLSEHTADIAQRRRASLNENKA